LRQREIFACQCNVEKLKKVMNIDLRVMILNNEEAMASTYKRKSKKLAVD